MTRTETAVYFILLLVAALGLLFLLAFAVSLNREGVTARLLALSEGTPREGWAYWEELEWRKVYQKSIVPGTIWLVLFSLVVGAIVRVGKRLFANRISLRL